MVKPPQPAITPRMCSAARHLLDWTQEDLAHAAGLKSAGAVMNYERESRGSARSTIMLIEAAFARNGVTFEWSREESVIRWATTTRAVK